jgi:hypothetical protein
MVPLERLSLPLSVHMQNVPSGMSGRIWTLMLRQAGPELQIVIEVKFGKLGPTPAVACAPQPKPQSLLPLFSLGIKGVPPLLAPLCSPGRLSSRHPLSCPFCSLARSAAAGSGSTSGELDFFPSLWQPRSLVLASPFPHELRGLN